MQTRLYWILVLRDSRLGCGTHQIEIDWYTVIDFSIPHIVSERFLDFSPPHFETFINSTNHSPEVNKVSSAAGRMPRITH